MTDVPKLVVDNKTDTDRASEYRARAGQALSELIAIMNDAHRAGLRFDFSIQRDQFGTAFLQGCYVTRTY